MDHLDNISRETFRDMPVDSKLDIIFDILSRRCAECAEDFDKRYEKKRGPIWKVGFLAVIALGSALGGFVAHILGVETIQIQK